jgi:hypothetical protein
VGQVLFILMTNRPDKLDTDIKRPGRLDRKIPFFYAETAAERAAVVSAVLKRYRVPSISRKAPCWPPARRSKATPTPTSKRSPCSPPSSPSGRRVPPVELPAAAGAAAAPPR